MADDLDKENQETDFDLGADDGFNDFNNQQSLGNVIQSNPILKIGIIAAAFVVIIGGFLLFGGSSNTADERSTVGQTDSSGLREAPTTSDVTDSYKEAIDQFNEQKEEDANRTGDSFIPIPTGTATDTTLMVPENDAAQEDPLERWRILQEERARQQEQQVAQQTQTLKPGELSPEEQKRQDIVQKLSQSMLGSMQQLSQGQKVAKMNVENIMDDEQYYEDLEEEAYQKEIKKIDRRQEYLEKQNALAEIDPTLQANADDVAVQGNVIVPEGTIEYAQMLIQADSDIPGPVLAQIVTGPLAGSRVIGSFSVAEDSYLVIQFQTVIVNGQSVQISAIAVDPDTNLTGVVTDVNHRYFKRLILPVAAEFISGLAGAIAETQTTTNVTGDVVVVDNNDLDTEEEIATAIQDAGDKISDFVEDEADKTKVQVKVAAGTPIGILFLAPLIEGGANAQQNANIQ